MHIHDLEFPDLARWLAEQGEPDFRARQVWQGLYRHVYQSPAQFSNLPTHLREQLSKSFEFQSIKPLRQIESADGQTRKTVFKLHDGLLIEAVLMKYDPVTFSGKGRRTLCISSQAGCAMGCVFCATGQMGYKRNLSSGEIVAQVLYYAGSLQEHDEKVTNVVLMGMGEPFHNYENTMLAIDRLNDPQGYNLGARRFTISTVGLVPQIRRFADEKRQVNLAISLHAAEDDKRNSILPVNKRYPIPELLDACRYYIEKTRRRVTFEWAMINGVNDTPEVAALLAARLKGLLCHVNAIPLNPTAGYRGTGTTRARAQIFKDTLETAGIPCTIRMRRGIDIQAGCGQLAGEMVLSR